MNSHTLMHPLLRLVVISLDYLGKNTCNNTIIRNIFCHDRIGSNLDIIAAMHRLDNLCSMGNVAIITYNAAPMPMFTPAFILQLDPILHFGFTTIVP